MIARVPVLVSRTGALPASSIRSAAVKQRAERMLRALALPDAELSILLCDDETIHGLNRQHRRKDKPTDVLAFATREAGIVPGQSHVLGDVVISLETAARQAREQQRTLWDEVTMLLAHGLLHLLGFDHATRAEERRMTARTDALRAAAGPRTRLRPPSGQR
jgi:probable rRNA maturation factor